jgi:hypothetical protein
MERRMHEGKEREWSTLEKKYRKRKTLEEKRMQREIEIVFFQSAAERKSFLFLLSILQPQCTVRFTVTAENYSVKC